MPNGTRMWRLNRVPIQMLNVAQTCVTATEGYLPPEGTCRFVLRRVGNVCRIWEAGVSGPAFQITNGVFESEDKRWGFNLIRYTVRDGERLFTVDVFFGQSEPSRFRSDSFPRLSTWSPLLPNGESLVVLRLDCADSPNVSLPQWAMECNPIDVTDDPLLADPLTSPGN